MEKLSRMILISALASVAIILPAAARSQARPSVSTSRILEPTDLPSGHYVVDPDHTSVTARINHMGLSNFTIRFGGIGGAFDFDPRNPDGSRVDITLDPTALETGIRAFDKALTGPLWFNTAQFPRMEFHATRLRRHGLKGVLEGNLTIRGVTHPATMDLTFNGAGPSHPGLQNHWSVGFSGTMTVNRSDFGMDFLVGQGIADEVSLLIEAEFRPAG